MSKIPPRGEERTRRARRWVGLLLGLAVAACQTPREYWGKRDRVAILKWSITDDPLSATPFAVGVPTVVRYLLKDEANRAALTAESEDPTLFATTLNHEELIVTALRVGSGDLVWKRNGVELDRITLFGDAVSELRWLNTPLTARVFVGARMPAPAALISRSQGGAFFGGNYLDPRLGTISGDLVLDGSYLLVNGPGRFAVSLGALRVETNFEVVEVAAVVALDVTAEEPSDLGKGNYLIRLQVDARDEQGHVGGADCSWNDSTILADDSSYTADRYYVQLKSGQSRHFTCTLGAHSASVDVMTP